MNTSPTLHWLNRGKTNRLLLSPEYPFVKKVLNAYRFTVFTQHLQLRCSTWLLPPASNLSRLDCPPFRQLLAGELILIVVVIDGSRLQRSFFKGCGRPTFNSSQIVSRWMPDTVNISSKIPDVVLNRGIDRWFTSVAVVGRPIDYPLAQPRLIVQYIMTVLGLPFFVCIRSTIRSLTEDQLTLLR